MDYVDGVDWSMRLEEEIPKLLKRWSGRWESNPRRPAWEIDRKLKTHDHGVYGDEYRSTKFSRFCIPDPKPLVNGVKVE
jgi:hypothetical protein